MARKLRILYFDLETTPLIYYSWHSAPKYLPMDFLIEDSYILTWSAKWSGEKKVHSRRLTPEEAVAGQDLRIVSDLRDMIAEADIIVAHNIAKFDWPRINGRFVMNGLEPVQPPRTIDTLRLARKNFGFAYNKLDYLAQEFGFGNKIRTEFDWWKHAKAGDEKYLKKMERYNRRDVVLLEQVFEHMKPHVRNLPRLVEADFEGEWVCPSCGSHDLIKRGFHRTNASTFQTWQCKECGRYSRERVAQKPKKVALHPL